jgi:hypothetical protein
MAPFGQGSGIFGTISCINRYNVCHWKGRHIYKNSVIVVKENKYEAKNQNISYKFWVIKFFFFPPQKVNVMNKEK